MSVNYTSNKVSEKLSSYKGILPTEENKIFLSHTSHNIKNPFGALLGYSNLLLEDYSELSDSEKLLYLSEIDSTARFTFKYLERFLEWIYLKTGKVVLDIKKNNLSEIISHSINTVLSSVDNVSNINICIDEKLYANVDFDSVSKMLVYILENSVKYSQPNADIFITAYETEEQISVVIEDHGIGISDEVMKKLFDISARLSAANSSETSTGLGLILSKEIINLNNGSINLKSNENGTKVTVKLPKNNF